MSTANQKQGTCLASPWWVASPAEPWFAQSVNRGVSTWPTGLLQEQLERSHHRSVLDLPSSPEFFTHITSLNPPANPLWVMRTILTAKVRKLRFRGAHQFLSSLSASGDRLSNDPGRSDPKACLYLWTACLPLRDDACKSGARAWMEQVP